MTAAEATAGVIPIALTAGVALRVTERSFRGMTGRSSETYRKTKRKTSKRSRKRSRRKTKSKGKRRKKTGPERIMDEFRPRR